MSAATTIPAIVFGATGYVGGEFLRLLAMHPVFELAAAVSASRAGDRIAGIFPHLASAYPDTRLVAYDEWLDSIPANAKLALFSAAPHGTTAVLIKAAMAAAATKNIDLHVVDTSADFRYVDQAAFEAVYGTAHGAPELLTEFVSAVPELLNGTPARHAGHPGCFASAVLLAAMPLLAAGLCENDLFVSGITGSTGAGRTPQTGTHHPERNSNLYAYKALLHRHGPEIIAQLEQATGVRTKLNFVPHSGPFARGIYVTLQARASDAASPESVRTAFDKAYANASFVDVLAAPPRLKDVVASNRCQVSAAMHDGTIVVLCAIDNLVKGAAGGAMQWMNRLWDLPETTGLHTPAPGWT
ncbi:MAG TPA: N-acetyl-gamma-glutamyl-phosphate reductase [Woeseiaceae bacterium]|nr:N-acetyl-gamma-glutamyl-phosphate reductase [Woeseiaceae bacterium]